MSNAKQWVAARFNHSTSFSPVDAETVKYAHVVETGKKKFDDWNACMDECKLLTEEKNCAEWEFVKLTDDYIRKLNDLATDKRFFDPRTSYETRDSIYAVVRILEAMQRGLVP